MATFGEIQTRVQQIIIDLPTAVTAQVPTLVRESVRRLTRLHDFKVCETTSSLYQTTLDTRVLAAVPADFYKWRGKPYMINEIGKVKELGVYSNRADAIREWGTDIAGVDDIGPLDGEPRFLSLSDATDELGTMNFEVWPLPDEGSLFTNGNWRIQVPYVKYLTALSGNSDTNWFTVNADTWLTFDAAAEGFFLDWDEQRATTWKAKAQQVYKEVVDTDKRLRFSGMTALIPHSDANDWRGQPGDQIKVRF